MSSVGMCYGICKTGEKCKRDYWLDVNGLCRDHQRQYYTLVHQRKVDRARKAHAKRYVSSSSLIFVFTFSPFTFSPAPATPIEKVEMHLDNARKILDSMNSDIDQLIADSLIADS